MLLHTDNREILQVTVVHQIVQLGGEHGETLQVLTIGQHQAVALSATVASDFLRAQYLQDWVGDVAFLARHDHLTDKTIHINTAICIVLVFGDYAEFHHIMHKITVPRI